MKFHKAYLLVVIAVLCGIFFALLPSSFGVGNGNYVTLTFVQNKLSGAPLWYDNSGVACQESPVFTVLAGIGNTTGWTVEQTWVAASLLVIILGVLAWFLFTSSLFGDWIGLLSSFLVFLLVDEHALASLVIPRHVALFILTPLAYYFFFQFLKNSDDNRLNVKAAAAGVLFAALTFAVHLLFGFFLFLSLSMLLIVRLARKDWNSAKRIFGFLVAASIFSVLLSLGSVSSAASFSHPYYGDYALWGFALPLGLWMLNPLKVLYSTKIILYYVGLLACCLPFLLAWKSKGAKNSFGEDFLTANLAAAFLFTFTPFSMVLAKLITPGVLAEQLVWKLSPFYLVIPLSLGVLWKAHQAHKSHPRAVLAGAAALLVVVVSLSHPLLFVNATVTQPVVSAADFLGGVSDLQGGHNVASDLHSSFLLPYFANATVLASDPGYLVCAKKNDLDRLSALQVLLSDASSEDKRQIVQRYNVTAVFVNKAAWDLRLVQVSESKVVALPQTFEQAVANAENLRNEGFTRTNVGENVVFLKSSA